VEKGMKKGEEGQEQNDSEKIGGYGTGKGREEAHERREDT